MSSKIDKYELKAKASSLTANVIVGKKGITQEVADELLVQLKKDHLIKVKILKTVGKSTKDVAEELAIMTKSHLIDVRGSTAVFYF
ncbi:MAG: YhbY family RNA-binding protein [Methanosarcinales archaeon]|nr:YhbY family RNA-binding protein [Methanosarcinales archaeon]